MTELKRCPFCGGIPKMHMISQDFFDTGTYTTGYSVFCQNCRCATEYELTQLEAIEAWNRRQTMTDYIERDSALRIIIQKQKELCPLGTYGKKYVDGYDREKFDDWQEIIDGIESVPAADVAEVKHGKWIEYLPVLGAGNLQIRCSECGLTNDFKTSYCPNCGAKMDLED